ncbi:MAG TPA: BON domain-containing protein [Dehalococcoidia bacterium]|nr:BON domain-containing protein [Dehalococcoidia bacterium]
MQEPVRFGVRGSLALSELEPEVRLLWVGEVVYLEGRVHSYERKKRLAQLAAEMPSVTKVVNRLRVVPGSHLPDERVREQVLTALGLGSLVTRADISVRVRDGVVELQGTVPDISTRIAAEVAAWSACGVQHVANRLQVVAPGPLRSRAPWA